MDFKVTNARPADQAALRETGDPGSQRPAPAAPLYSGSPSDWAKPEDPTLDLRGQELVTRPEPSRWRSLIHRQYRIGRKWSLTQVLGALLIAGVCVAAVVWYVPRVMTTDRRMLTGDVTSSGVVALNFQNPGVISVIKVQPNQSVHKGQVLAVEYAPNEGAIVQADKAAISAVQAKIAELKTNETLYPATIPDDQAQIASENAQMATDQAQLETDRMRMAATEIVAPSAGVIVAANGKPGEAVTSSGIRDYASSAPQGAGSQQPQFSLLPEGPQSVGHASAGGSSLPVVALRVSFTWSVVALIPEDRVSNVKSEQPVTVSVPAAGIRDVPGQIQEVLPNPAASSTGPLYQAMISITGSVRNPPLDGMAANIELRR